MYRIMLVAKEGTGEINNLYKFFTVTNTEGQVVPYEVETLEELDTQVEKMLNGKYAKKDLLIVQAEGFNIDADLFKAINPTPTDPTEDETSTETTDPTDEESEVTP